MLLGVDVGGTFTDAVLVGPDGAIHTAKVPTMPADQARGVLEAIGAVLARAGAQPGKVERFAHGMTVATNALLEGRGARTALIATEGFGDVVELGRQARPHLYRLCEASPAPLVAPELRLEAPERMTPEGPLRALSREAAGALVARLARERRPEAVAVALLHSYAHPEHEQLLGELLAERLPGVHVSLSHELVGTFREYERAASTEVDAALSPLLGTYLRRLCVEADAIGLARPAVMQSSGGLIDAEGAAAHAALTVLSGPAGGVRGAQLLAELAGEPDVLCFDMGGTSCDVCLIHGGEVAETAAGVVAGRPLALAMLDIHTVGAGGGSIAWRDVGGALRVGPRSAGADPGPACYGRGGEHPTVTDANLLLGRLPGGTGDLAGGLALDREAAERAVARLAAELDLTVTRCAEGIVRVAEAEMLGALRVMSVERGLDPREPRTAGVRRRGTAARGGAGAGAGDAAHPLPACVGRAVRIRARGGGAAARRGAHGDARRREPVRGASGASAGGTARAGLRGPGRDPGADRGQLRAALSRPVLRAGGRGGRARAARPGRPARVLRACPRATLRLSRRDGRGRAGHDQGLRVGRCAGVVEERPARERLPRRCASRGATRGRGRANRPEHRGGAAAPRTVSGRAGRSRARRGVPARRAAAGYTGARSRDLRAGRVDVAGARRLGGRGRRARDGATA